MAIVAPQQVGPVAESEYLAMEAASAFKHEYLDGEVHLLAGASENHNRLAMNVGALLLAAARGTGCRVLGSDMRLRIATPTAEGGERVLHYYPDLQVVCDPTDADPLVKTRPCVIVEISRPSTAAIDGREKLLAYRGITSLRSYLLVAQDRRHTVHHYRDEQGAWFKAELTDRGNVRVRCLNVTLTLDAIYEGVLEPDPTAPAPTRPSPETGV